MISTRIQRALLTFFASLAIVIGIGPGHSLFMAQLGAHGFHVSPAASHCQLVCAPVNPDNSAYKENLKDPKEPDTLFYQRYSLQVDSEAAIIVAILVAGLAFLRARPPDLLVQYSLLRI